MLNKYGARPYFWKTRSCFHRAVLQAGAPGDLSPLMSCCVSRTQRASVAGNWAHFLQSITVSGWTSFDKNRPLIQSANIEKICPFFSHHDSPGKNVSGLIAVHLRRKMEWSRYIGVNLEHRMYFSYFCRIHFKKLQIYKCAAPHEMYMCLILGTHIIGNTWEGFLKSAHQYCL